VNPRFDFDATNALRARRVRITESLAALEAKET